MEGKDIEEVGGSEWVTGIEEGRLEDHSGFREVGWNKESEFWEGAIFMAWVQEKGDGGIEQQGKGKTEEGEDRQSGEEGRS